MNKVFEEWCTGIQRPSAVNFIICGAAVINTPGAGAICRQKKCQRQNKSLKKFHTVPQSIENTSLIEPIVPYLKFGNNSNYLKKMTLVRALGGRKALVGNILRESRFVSGVGLC